MKIAGFTLIRNGLKYDYPFRESLESLGALTNKVYVALGSSEDGTEAIVNRYSFIKTIPTVWDDNLRKSGLILSQQTNIALQAVREDTSNDWGFYLQGDEVLSEKDFELIRKDIEIADQQGYDAIRFRYLHFWLDYNHICIGARWYPHEIRAIKLKSNIESYGDAQSFKNVQKIYESEAFIYHYGHVRESSSYEKKKRDFHRYWHDDSQIEKIIEKSESEDRTEETLLYFGPHSNFMKNRIGKYEVPSQPEVYIKGDSSHYSPELLKNICCDNVHWVKSIPNHARLSVSMEKNFLKRLFGQETVPPQMKFPNAPKFPNDLWLILKLSQVGIGIKNY